MYALRYLVILCVTLPILYILHVARSTLQGFGDTVTPMVSGVGELAGRVLTVYLLSPVIGTDAFFIAETIAWIASDSVLIGKLIRSFHILPMADL